MGCSFGGGSGEAKGGGRKTGGGGRGGEAKGKTVGVGVGGLGVGVGGLDRGACEVDIVGRRSSVPRETDSERKKDEEGALSSGKSAFVAKKGIGHTIPTAYSA